MGGGVASTPPLTGRGLKLQNTNTPPPPPVADYVNVVRQLPTCPRSRNSLEKSLLSRRDLPKEIAAKAGPKRYLSNGGDPY